MAGRNSQLVWLGLAALLVFALGFLAGGWSSGGSVRDGAGAPRSGGGDRAAGRGSGSVLSGLDKSSPAERLPDLRDEVGLGVKVERVLGILRTGNPADRLIDWGNLMRTLKNAEDVATIEAALAQWYRDGGQAIDGELKLFHFRQGQLVGRLALEEHLPADANGKLNINQVRQMRGWANTRPAEAREWIDSLAEGSVKRELTKSWFEGAISADPQRSQELYASLPVAVKAEALPALMDAVFKVDGLAGLEQWFSSVSAEPDSGLPVSTAFGSLMWRMGQQPGAGQAIAMLRDPNNLPYVSENAFNGATRSVARRKPGQMIELLGELSGEGQAFDDATVRKLVRGVVQNSSGTTINNLGDWLIENPNHRLYDMTTRYFVEQAAREDREAATAWVEQISDPGLRAEADAMLR